jgi:hypothetical protein
MMFFFILYSTKYNLILGGIKSEGAIENTENVVKKISW